MRVTHVEEAERYEPEPNWVRWSMCAEPNISIERFVKPPGHASPNHSHPNIQVLIVVEGRLSITTEADGTQVLDVGDTAYIPAGEDHVVTNPLTTPSTGIDIFVPGRSFDYWVTRDQGDEEDA